MNWLRRMLVRIETRNVNLLVLVTFLTILLLSIAIFAAVALESGRFASVGETLWWVVKAILGPDYLDEEHGTFLAAISFLVVLVGFVAFGSGTIAIVSQLVSQKVEGVKKGLTRVPFRGHTVILNFNDKIFETLREIIVDGSRSEVAVLSDQDKEWLEGRISHALGNGAASRSLVVCRQGHPQYQTDLERVGANRAARIVVLSPQADDPGETFRGDMVTLKLLMTLNRSSLIADETPVIVEMGDPRSAEHVRRLVHRENMVLVDGNGVIGQILCQASLQPHLVPVFDELVSYRGSEFYFRKPAVEKGRHSREEFFRRYLAIHSRDIPVGLVSGGRLEINPAIWEIVDGTEVAVVAEGQDPALPAAPGDRVSARREPQAIRPARPETLAGRTVLIVGANSKLTYILDGYLAFIRCGHLAPDGGGLDVTVACEDPLDLSSYSRGKMVVRQERLDVLGRTERLHEILQARSFDSVIILSREGVSLEERDVDALTAVLLMSEAQDHLAKGTPGARPQVIVELLDARNREIVQEYGVSDVVVTTQLVSHLIAQCIRSPQLKTLFDTLLNYGENNVYVKPSVRFFAEGETMTFGEMVGSLSVAGEIPLGVVEEGNVLLNPSFDHGCTASRDLGIVVVSSQY